MFCSNCGAQIEDGAGFCPFCGSAQNTQQQYNQQQYTQQLGGQPNQQYQQAGQQYPQYQNSQMGQQYPQYQNPPTGSGNDTGSIWWAIPGIIPLAGFIIFFAMRKEKPKSAKMALIGACVGVVINLLLMGGGW